MLKFIRGAVALLILLACGPAQATVRILATTSDWGALATELGGDRVSVYVATNALQDVHRVDAKPSLVARARTADLVIATGAELEIGWLPVLVQESGNPRVQPGALGYFEAAAQLNLLEVPTRLDRSLGDIHPQGNPHLQLDPHNIAAVAKALTSRLAVLDAGNAEYYQKRGSDFDTRWTQAIARWEQMAAPLRGIPVVVMHRDQVYLCHWLGLQEVAAIEPKPGVPPSAGHLSQLVSNLSASPPKLILLNAYNDAKAANWLSKRVNVPVVTLPFSVGGTSEAKDLFGLFDDTINRLQAAIQ
jgi:zinc/manganese transport system substrate-binding protein